MKVEGLRLRVQNGKAFSLCPIGSGLQCSELREGLPGMLL